jgi:hypothetical protein
MTEQEIIAKLQELTTRMEVVELKTTTIPAGMKLEQAIEQFNDVCATKGLIPADIIEIRSMLRALSASGSGRIFRYGLIATIMWPLNGLAAAIKAGSEKILARVEAADAKAKAESEAKNSTARAEAETVPATAG